MTSIETLEERWARVTRKDTAIADVAEGALLIAAHEYPQLDIDGCLQQLHDMAQTLQRRLRPDISASDMLLALNRYLFGELGFAGNAVDYYDPRNSYLNDVLERRVGIPISLAVVYIDIGRRLGLPLEGVSFPSHFLVKCALRNGVVIVDPYGKGATLSADELRRRLAGAGEDIATDESALLGTVLRSATVPETLARMLRNLRAIYLHHADLQKALWAADRIVLLVPESGAEYRERGRIYLELECFRAALADFRSYAARAPDAAQAEGMSATIAELELRAARLN